jgi:hypothetical protein
MAIGLATAGAYTSTYNGVGITGDQRPSQQLGLGFNDDTGYEIEQQTHGEMIDRTDLYGQSLMDWVHQGGSVFITFTCMTFQADRTLIKNVFYPWGATPGLLGRMLDDRAPIGRLASQVAKALVLTVVAETPAATTGPSTLTANLAIRRPGNDRLMYTTRVRKVPCNMALLPFAVSSGVDPYNAIAWWQET